MKIKHIIHLTLIFYLFFLTACGKKEARVFNPKYQEYHNGVAWIQLEESELLLFTKYADLVCVDENGKEIFSMPDVNINQVSNFYNDMALIKGQYIIDKTGTFTHDLINEFGVKIKMFPNNYFDGFIFVEKNVNGVTMTGMLNSNLEWVIEPTSKFNDIEPRDNFLYHNYAVGYYDALMNEFIDEDEYKLRHIQRCYPESGLIFLSNAYDRKFNYSYGTVSGEIELDASSKTGFYNQYLKMVLDLSEYPSINPLSDFQNGKCIIEFITEQKSSYVGLINLEGDFIFIKPVRHGDFVEYNAEKIEFKDCYFDWNGNYFLKRDENM